MPRSSRRHHEEEAENDERWLLTYADMITLLMALFMVLFSISSVNISKFESLQRSLKNAFSGGIVGGGQSIMENGGAANDTKSMSPPLNSLAQSVGGQGGQGVNDKAAKAEQDKFTKLKGKLDSYSAKAGLSGKVNVEVTPDGLRIRLLTDKLLFASGSATPEPKAAGLLSELGRVLGSEGNHPIRVSGYTDNQAIRSSKFPSNWELSTARASAIVRAFASAGVQPWRLTATGRAALDPVASNSTPAGRAINRRVEIMLPATAPTTATTTTPGRQSSP